MKNSVLKIAVSLTLVVFNFLTIESSKAQSITCPFQIINQLQCSVDVMYDVWDSSNNWICTVYVTVPGGNSSVNVNCCVAGGDIGVLVQRVGGQPPSAMQSSAVRSSNQTDFGTCAGGGVQCPCSCTNDPCGIAGNYNLIWTSTYVKIY